MKALVISLYKYNKNNTISVVSQSKNIVPEGIEIFYAFKMDEWVQI